jgi:hypothetical protein
MKYSAKMLLLAFQVQRNSILNLCEEVSIAKQTKSLTSVAKRYRPVAKILAVDGRRRPLAGKRQWEKFLHSSRQSQLQYLYLKLDVM